MSSWAIRSFFVLQLLKLSIRLLFLCSFVETNDTVTNLIAASSLRCCGTDSCAQEKWASLRWAGRRTESPVFYYAHLQKTGGTRLCHLAVESGLKSNPMWNCDPQVLHWDAYPLARARQWRFLDSEQHESAIFGKGWQFIANEVQLPASPLPCPDRIVYVATLRPPIDRLVSHFIEFKFQAANANRSRATLEGFVEWALDDTDAFHNNNLYVRYFSGFCVGRNELCHDREAFRYASFRFQNYFSGLFCMRTLDEDWHTFINASTTTASAKRQALPHRHHKETLALQKSVKSNGDIMRLLEVRNSLDLEFYDQVMLRQYGGKCVHDEEFFENLPDVQLD